LAVKNNKLVFIRMDIITCTIER